MYNRYVLVHTSIRQIWAWPIFSLSIDVISTGGVVYIIYNTPLTTVYHNEREVKIRIDKGGLR